MLLVGFSLAAAALLCRKRGLMVATLLVPDHAGDT
jgi:hypothetical protein